MKHQDLIKYHQMTAADLTIELNKLGRTFLETRLKTSLGQLKNTGSSKNIRRDIARLQTILKNQQLKEKV